MIRCNKILNFTLNVLIICTSFLLFINIFLDIQTSLLHKSYKSFFGFSVFEIKTGSMAGTVEIGDWILVKNTKNVDLNDVITFDDNGNFVTHRVVQKYNDMFVTRGDSNNVADAPIDSSQVVGKVIKVLPKLGIFRNIFLNIHVLIPFIVFLIFLCLVIDGKIDNRKENKLKSFSSNSSDIPIIISSTDLVDDDYFSTTSVLSKIDIVENEQWFSSLHEQENFKNESNK